MPRQGDITAVGGDSYQYPIQGVKGDDGRTYTSVIALGLLTDTLQTTIPLKIYSNHAPALWQTPSAIASDANIKSSYPPILLSIPVGAQIQRLSFRTPNLYPTPGQPLTSGSESVRWGAYMPQGCTLVGTTGELLKITANDGTIYTNTSPVLAAASSAYAPNTAIAYQRVSGGADQSSPDLMRTVSGSAVQLILATSNSGSSAVGTGIKLSLAGAKAVIVAEVVYATVGNGVDFGAIDNLNPTVVTG
jgi:hypothetical protein